MIKIIKYQVLIAILILYAHLPLMAAPDDDKGESYKAQQMLEYYKSIDKQLIFYGKIVDSNNNPVANANVSVQIENSSGVKTIVVNSNTDGAFEILNEIGNGILINDINCSGYEFKRNKSVRRSFNNGSYVPDKNNPFIYIVRKKEAATLVLKGDLKWLIDPNISYYEVDLVELESGRPGYLKDNNTRARTDVKIKTVMAAEKNAFVVIFDGKDSNSGIMEINSLLYVPPETGYQKTLSLEIPIGETITKHIYIKGRNGGIYSRMDTTLSADANGVIISANVFTNPNGLRNVDFDVDLYAQYIKQRFDEDRQRNIDRELRKLELYKKVQ